VGGVVGVTAGKVQYCYATGIVSGSLVGGVVGQNEPNNTVQYCYATGIVSGTKWAGGVVGANLGTVQSCYATSDVTGNNYGGGVVGLNAYDGSVQYCYATGNVFSAGSSSYAGGLVGCLMNDDPSSPEATVKNCLGLNPNVSGTNTHRVLGGLYTYVGTPTLTNNYGRSDMQKNGGSTTWANIGPNDLDGESITSSNWGSQNWWTTPGNWDTAGWDFTNIWQWGSNYLPILRNMPGTATQNPVVKQ
jgi:hypothetical protein